MTEGLHIAIAETSEVIRRGVRSVLEEPAGMPHKTVLEIPRAEQLHLLLGANRPDILIMNPSFTDIVSLPQIRKEFPDLKCVMLQTSLADGAMAHSCDEAISVYDSADSIREKILRLAHGDHIPRRREPLSQREKDIVVRVVKGMTNKQIAEGLNISHHTVGTHRRNISAKLDIHSTSGLTVYAISNKLVRLDELEKAN